MRLANAPRVLGPRFPSPDEVRAVMRAVTGHTRAIVSGIPPALAKAGVGDDVDPESEDGRARLSELSDARRAIVDAVWRDARLHPAGFISTWSLARMHDLLTDEPAGDEAADRTGRSRLADEPDVVVPFTRGADRAHSPLRPTPDGSAFLAEPGGDVERRIDALEGLDFLLDEIRAGRGDAEHLAAAWDARWRELTGGRMEGRDLGKRTLAPRLERLVARGDVVRDGEGLVLAPRG